MTKTATFAVTHFSVAFVTVWFLTGDWRIGGLVALIEPAINTVAYFVHERAWNFGLAADRGRTRAAHNP